MTVIIKPSCYRIPEEHHEFPDIYGIGRLVAWRPDLQFSPQSLSSTRHHETSLPRTFLVVFPFDSEITNELQEVKNPVGSSVTQEYHLQDKKHDIQKTHASMGTKVKRIQMLIGITRLSSMGDTNSIIPAMIAMMKAPYIGVNRSRTRKVTIIPAPVPSQDFPL